MSGLAQLSFFADVAVSVAYLPDVAPPDATDPFEVGTYVAWLGHDERLSGVAGNEHDSIVELAKVLRRARTGRVPNDQLSAAGRALAAAEQLTADELIAFLLNRSMTPVLA